MFTPEEDRKKMKNKLAGSLQYIIKTIYYYDKFLLAVILINNLFVIIAALSPIIWPRYIIDSLIGGEDFGTVLRFILLFSITTISASGISYLLKSSIYLRSMTLRFGLIIKSGKKFISMDYENFENPQVLDASGRADRATANNASGFEGIMHKFANLGGNILIAATLLVILGRLNLWIVALICGLLIVNYIVGKSLNRFEKKIQDGLISVDRKWQYILNLLNDISCYKDIYLFHMKDMIFGKIQTLGQTKINEARKVHGKREMSNQAISLLQAVQELLIYLWLGYLVVNDRLTIGEYTMYMTAVTVFYQSLKSIIDDFLYISLQSESVEDYRRFMELPTKVDEKNALELQEEIHTITLEKVGFRYIGAETPAVENINLTIQKNEKIAVVGLNGAGKTTFIKLLTKLYEPTEGTIYFNGINSQKIKRTSLYKAFSVVFQESNLFAFSVAENISMKPIEYTQMERAAESAESVGLGDVIGNLTKGYRHPVLKMIESDGVEFSGGEVQKLSLARALYKNGQIMILDEPTSAYDALAEEQIYRQFNELAQDKTVIFISHRLVSTRFCNRILVFDQGHIVEEGTHEKLLKQGGKYAELFQIQARQYQEAVQ